MKLYSFFNSSASYRVRIALALKGINYQTEGVNIRIGQQNELAYRRMNPVGLVPTLLTDEGESLGQSLAIIDWLERHYPQVPLVPQEEPARNKVLEIVYAIACDIHPLNNLRVLRYLTEELNVSEEEKKRWYAHWIQQGLSAVEQLLRQKPVGAILCGRDADAGRLLPCPAVGERATHELRFERVSTLQSGVRRLHTAASVHCRSARKSTR